MSVETAPSFDENLAQLLQLITRIEEDDMINRQKLVLDRLATIRVGKKKILDHVQILMEKGVEEEDKTLDLIGKLVNSYNDLKIQEEEFSSAMNQIIDNNKKVLDEMMPKICAIQQKISNDSEQENNEENDSNQDSLPEVEKLLQKLDNMKGMISGVGAVLKEAVDSSRLLDEHLKTRLKIFAQLKNKTAMVQQLQKKAVEAQAEKSAQRAPASSNVNSISDRKNRQLERLRREAARRGLLNNAGDTSAEKEISQTENKTEQSVNPECQRIPPIPELPNLEASTDNSDKKKNELRTRISERFTSIEARKHRMRQIQTKLNSLQQKKMENTYEEALKRFKNLTEMRSKLEELQTVFDKSNVEEGEGADERTDADKNGLETKLEDIHEHDDLSVSTNELINEVRQSFNEAFNKDKTVLTGTSIDSQTTGQMPGSSSFESAFSTLGDRLKVIENVLHTHTDQLIWIGNQYQQTEVTAGQNHSVEASNKAEECCIKAKQIVLKVMEFVSHLFGELKTGKIDSDFTSRLIFLLIDKATAESTPESHEKITKNFPLIIEELLGKYYHSNFDQVEEQLKQELAETLENEFAFLFLMQDATALTEDHRQ